MTKNSLILIILRGEVSSSRSALSDSQNGSEMPSPGPLQSYFGERSWRVTFQGFYRKNTEKRLKTDKVSFQAKPSSIGIGFSPKALVL